MAEETEKERIDREVIELLNELRVTLPGVQVLFAFLLILPFQPGFADITPLDRAVFLLAFFATTAATVCLIAPATYHRIQFRARDKKRMLRLSNRLVIVGTLCLGVAITAAVYLITQVVIGDVVASVAALVAAVLLLSLWYGLPIIGRLRKPGGGDESEPAE